MRLTLADQIKQSKHFYAIPIGKYRYSVYRVTEGQLEVLWPQVTGDKDRVTEMKLLSTMVYSRNKNLPAYHFKTDYVHYLERDLQKINPDATIDVLTGWAINYYRN